MLDVLAGPFQGGVFAGVGTSTPALPRPPRPPAAGPTRPSATPSPSPSGSCALDTILKVLLVQVIVGLGG
jgi:hypothetical protein